jgi:hypothetical protein
MSFADLRRTIGDLLPRPGERGAHEIDHCGHPLGGGTMTVPNRRSFSPGE